MAYLDTPKTDVGNATFLQHGKGIDDVSIEMSFASPKKRQGDLLSQIRGNTNGGLRTPNTRRALVDRPNISKKGTNAEFTPLLKSATKNLARKGKENMQAPRTPAFLKTLREVDEDGGLPISESSVVIASDSDNTDVVARQAAVNRLPNMNSSSILSTPMLGKGKGERMLEEQRNLMTLREQESIINKTEKENFGLKLKIHFLEEMLANSDPNLNQEAIRANTDLRVDRATLQRELNKVKKQLQNSARDTEMLRLQMLQDNSKADQPAADKHLRKELEVLRQTVQVKEQQIETLQYRLEGESRTQEVADLKGAIEDLEADLREKDRIIDSHQDEQDNSSDQLQRIKDLKSELEEANEKLEELQESQARNDELRAAARQAKQNLADAAETERQKDAAIEDGREQLEEVQSNFRALREKYDLLKDGYKTKSATIQDLENALADAKAHARDSEQELIREREAARRRQEDLLHSKAPVEERLQSLLRQLDAQTDEKDLLQTRHDALTEESESLQRDLSRTKAENSQLQLEVDVERRRSVDNEKVLKEESRRAQDKSAQETSRLRASLEAERSRVESIEDQWHSKCKEFQHRNEILEKRTTALQQTVDTLQQSEGNLSTRESRLQTSLAAEKKRHQTEESVLQRQIQDLQSESASKRDTADKYRNEATKLKEDLKVRAKELENAVQKQEALEDEIVVLQNSMDEDAEGIKQQMAQLKDEVRAQRTQLSNNKVETSHFTSKLETAESKIRSLREDVQTRSSKKNHNDSRLTELSSLVTDLQAENRSLSSELKKAGKRAQELETQAQLEGKDLSFFRHDNEDRQGKISELEAEKRSLARNLRSAQDQIKELEVQISIEHKDQSFLRHDQDEKQSKVLALQLEKRTLSTGLSEALEHIKELEAQADAKLQDRDLSKHDRENNLAKIQQLQSDKQSLSARLSEALSRIKELEFKTVAEQKDTTPRNYGFNDQRKESSILNRETSYKIEIARLEEKVADLRDQLRDQPRGVQAPRTPHRSPDLVPLATPNEIADLRHQLDDARSQSKAYRQQIYDLEKKARKTNTGIDKASHDRDDEVWQLQRELESKAHDLQLGRIELEKIRDAVDKSSSKLRARIQELEQDLRQARLEQTEDNTMAMERQDLHDMLKSAKLEAEDLRLQLGDHSAQVHASQEREKVLQSTMQRVRDERAEQQQRVSALSKDLSRLQDRYDGKVEELYQQASRLDVPQPKDKKTAAEMKGLARQIEWLKQNLTREKSFRQALTYEKHYYLQQIDMYNAW